jgi:hypothetical protein
MFGIVLADDASYVVGWSVKILQQPEKLENSLSTMLIMIKMRAVMESKCTLCPFA